MRSRNCCTSKPPEDGDLRPDEAVLRGDEPIQQEENVPRQDLDAGGKKRQARPPLSRKELLHLLGIMEGEVQARDDIIGLLTSQRNGQETLEARYGSAVPRKPLQALQRDGPCGPQDSVYQTPMCELDRLEEKQRETYRRMLEQLLLAEKCHRRTVSDLDDEKRKHADFINKSDDFTNLLEQERERLKSLLEQEKVYQARKEKDHKKHTEKVREELVKLKSFALLLVDEQQLHVEQIDEQSRKLRDLDLKLREKEQQLAAVSAAAKEDAQKVLKLEAELELRTAKFSREHEETGAKLAQQESQSRQLRLKMAGLSQKMEEMEESNKALRKSEEDLKELREKIHRGECGNSSLVAELENLRKRVLEMEGKDEEISRTEGQCKELGKRLKQERSHGAELRLEVEKLQKRMEDVEKLESVFSRRETECGHLRAQLEKERRAVSDLSGELEKLKTRVRDLEASGSKCEKAEMVLKDDLMKLKSLTGIMVDERKKAAERLRQEEQKSDDLRRRFKAEESKVTEVTERLIEESKKLLKYKSEMEAKVAALVKEKDEFKRKLAKEEEQCREVRTKMSDMKVRLEETERKRKVEKNPDEDNKVVELTQEIARLRGRLEKLEVVEGDLLKTEDEYDLLEKKFRREQDKANALTKLLEDMKGQIVRNKAIEKGEMMSPEEELRIRWRQEEARTRELQVDVQALKEKIHELMNAEDQLTQLRADYSVLQRRLVEEEENKKTVSEQVASLTGELEAVKRYSRALRPGTSSRRTSITSTAVQTDTATGEPGDEDTAGFIRKSVLEEKHLMNNLRQRGLKTPSVLERYPPASAELAARRSWKPWAKSDGAIPPPLPCPGQPLHIRVKPGHTNRTATLEISSPRAEDFFSSATIIPTLGLHRPHITIVPPTDGRPGSVPAGHGRTKSPVTITTVSRARTPVGGEGVQSPVSVITVSTTPVAEACAPAKPRETIKSSPETTAGSAPNRKYNSNIVTTDDNKIHIHLGPQFKGAPEGRGDSAASLQPQEVGTVLRSPRHISTGKMTSSLTITPVSSAASRPAPSPSPNVLPPRGSATRIPVSRGSRPGAKACLGVSAVARLESRAESQLMKIELRKMTVCGPATSGGKG